MKSAILFLIFNRPDTTKQVFEEIRKAQPPRLYIAADGPRDHKLGEKDLCEETRAIKDKVDWDCEVKTLFREKNLGCGKAVSQAISWFFENEEEGIILEDDILPHPDFFAYCEELLEKYRNDETIATIDGRNHLYGAVKSFDSYGFLYYPHIWGWATWRRVWNKYNINLKTISWNKIAKNLKNLGLNRSAIRYWYQIFLTMKYRPLDTWDYQLSFMSMHNGLLNIMPYYNITRNIGFDDRATHTTIVDDKEATLKTESILPLKHPQKKEIKAEDINIETKMNNMQVSLLSHIKFITKFCIERLLNR